MQGGYFGMRLTRLGSWFLVTIYEATFCSNNIWNLFYEMWYDYIAVVVLHNFSELPLYGNKTCSSKPAYNQMKIQSYDWKCYILLSQLAWLFTILQNDNLTISWDFFQADSTKVSQHGCWCCQPEKISWYRNIIIL